MTKEELLALLQEKGLSDDEIKELLNGVLETLNKDFEKHDEDEEKEEVNEEQKMKDVFGI